MVGERQIRNQLARFQVSVPFSGRVWPSKDETMETWEGKAEDKDKSIKKLCFWWQMCFQVPRTMDKSTDICMMKGRLLCWKHILLSQAEMHLYMFSLFSLTLPMSQITDLNPAWKYANHSTRDANAKYGRDKTSENSVCVFSFGSTNVQMWILSLLFIDW